MGQIYEAMIDYLRVNEFQYIQDDQNEMITFGVRGREERWQVLIDVHQARSQIMVYSMLNRRCPRLRRHAMSEFLTRVNWGLILGNFELDLEDGEIRFKTSLDVDGHTLPEGLIRPLLVANLSTMNHYMPGLMDVMAGLGEPQAALKLCESQSAETDPDEDGPFGAGQGPDFWPRRKPLVPDEDDEL